MCEFSLIWTERAGSVLLEFSIEQYMKKINLWKKMLKMLLTGLARLFTPCHAVSGAIRGPYKRNNSVPSML